MRAAFWGILLVAPGAAGYAVRGITFVASQRFDVGHGFGNATLREISACRFVPNAAPLGEFAAATLADDGGFLVGAWIAARGAALDVRPVSRVALEGGPVDAEGLAYDASGALYVASETGAAASLAVGAYDASTGAFLGAPFAVPDDVVARARTNAGVERRPTTRRA